MNLNNNMKIFKDKYKRFMILKIFKIKQMQFKTVLKLTILKVQN